MDYPVTHYYHRFVSQTEDIRQLRARLKKGAITQQEYDTEIESNHQCYPQQESIGLDVLVHGEFERTMVEYLQELLNGFPERLGTELRQQVQNHRSFLVM